MHKPAVSIGMPVYNGGNFLRQALESILSQSFCDFELIISDNASIDDTKMIVSEFLEHDVRIRYTQQAKNIGPIKNFNYVLDKARADYFIWAAADDLWDNDWINVLFENMSESVAISFGHVNNIDSNGAVLRTYKPFDFQGSTLVRMIKYYFAEDYNGKANIIYGMYHTKELQQNGMSESFNGCYFGVDMLFVFSIIQQGVVVTDPSVLLYKRIDKVDVLEKSPSGTILNSFLMLNRIHYFLCYIFQAKTVVSKIIFTFFSPAKYFKSILFNINRFIRKR